MVYVEMGLPTEKKIVKRGDHDCLVILVRAASPPHFIRRFREKRGSNSLSVSPKPLLAPPPPPIFLYTSYLKWRRNCHMWENVLVWVQHCPPLPPPRNGSEITTLWDKREFFGRTLSLI